MRCRQWSSGEHLCQTVDDGHRYHLTVAMQGCWGQEGHEKCVDSDHIGPVWTLTVRSWSLQAALVLAATQPLHIWEMEDEDGGECDDE